jgi:hypothetical protein
VGESSRYAPDAIIKFTNSHRFGFEKLLVEHDRNTYLRDREYDIRLEGEGRECG